MKSKICFFITIAFAIFLTSCEVTIQSSTIPKDYIKKAQVYNGSYKGKFEEQNIKLDIIVSDDGKIDIKIFNEKLEAQILPGCESTVGGLKSITVDDSSQQIQMANFEFNPGSCFSVANKIEIDVRNPNVLKLYILKNMVHDPGDIVCNGSNCQYRNGGMNYSYYEGAVERQ